MTRQQRIWIAAALSAAGRYSMLWFAVATVGIGVADDRAGFAGLALAILAEWAFTNGPVKLLFERDRPDNSGVENLTPGWLTPPRSSSFPSGHSSAASFSTVILWAWNPAAGIASAVVMIAMATSRVVLRAHHRSDVLAGLLWGAILATVALLVAGDALPM
jgi:membrane-associated phospholipid phosphatase